MKRIRSQILKGAHLKLDSGDSLEFCDLRGSKLTALGSVSILCSLVDDLTIVEGRQFVQFENCFRLSSVDNRSMTENQEQIGFLEFDGDTITLLRDLVKIDSYNRGESCESLLALLLLKRQINVIATFGVLFIWSSEEWEVKTMLLRFMTNDEMFIQSRLGYKKQLLEVSYELLFYKDYPVRDTVASLIEKMNPSPVELRLNDQKFLNTFVFENAIAGIVSLYFNKSYLKSVNSTWLKEKLFEADKVEEIVDCLRVMSARVSEFDETVAEFVTSKFKNMSFPDDTFPESILLEVLYIIGVSENVSLTIEDYLFILNYHEDLVEEGLINCYYDNLETSFEIKQFVNKNLHLKPVQNFLDFLKQENALPKDYPSAP
jgi:hypothetical protein